MADVRSGAHKVLPKWHEGDGAISLGLTVAKDELPRITQAMRRELESLAQQFAIDLRDAIVEAAPEDKSRYADDIKIKEHVFVRKLSYKKYSISIPLDYAAAQEFGTARHAAQPYVYPTTERMWPDYLDSVRDRIQEIISRRS